MKHQVLLDILTVDEISDIAYQYRYNLAYQPTKHHIAQIRYYVENTLAYELWRANNPQIIHVSGQPYQTTDEMRQALRAGYLQISVDYNNSSIMSADLNLKFRAMHDLQHCRTSDCNFNLWGEICAYILASKQTHVAYIRDWLFSEIVGQVCYLRVFGTFPEQRNVLISNEYRLKCERIYNAR